MYLTITTVERTALDLDNVTSVTLPTVDGVITILPNHIPLVTPLTTGEMVISYQGEQSKFGASPLPMYVDGGVMQFSGNKMEVLTSLAEHAAELDEAKIEEARRKAEKLLADRPLDIDLAKIESSLQKELTKLKMVKRWRR